MSMERDYITHDTHPRSITALGCSPARREIFIGFEDGTVKSIEVDTGSLVQCYSEHKGWITQFLYWPKTKLLLCSSNDSVISMIGAGGNIMDRVFVGSPVYSMHLNTKREEIVFGISNGLQFHKIKDSKEGFSHYIDSKPSSIVREHTDIVKCVVVLDSRIYSTGYDGALVIYDCHFSGRDSAVKIYKNSRAHDAGISCLLVEKDSIENTLWVFTGSFDKTIKVWTGEGKIVHRFEGFATGITGLCYVPKNKTICCVAGTSNAFIFDPKSGEDVTDFIDTFVSETKGHHNLQLLKYLNDYNIMLASTSRRQLIVYRYNPSGCLTSLKCKQTLDSVCFTSKVPILIFTGDTSNQVSKWEQKQSNQLVYLSENLLKSEMVAKESSRIQGQAKQNTQKNENNNNESNLNFYSNKQNQLDEYVNIKRTNVVLKLVYVENLDYILAACEDGSIYVYCFDEEAVKILKDMKFTDENTKNEEKNFKYYKDYLKSMENTNAEEFDATNFDFAEETKAKEDGDSVTNRVAGYVLKKILSEHTSCVTCLVVVDRADLYPNRFLLSAGWDRRVCIWDLDKLRLFDLFRNKNVNNFEEVELASDGNILDMCYCPKMNYFAYASTDSMCYVRKFATYGSEMVLVNTLNGHFSEVNCIRWVENKMVWITGGEDGTVRIWSDNCEQIHLINCGGTVNSICIDFVEDALIVAVHDLIKIYEMSEYHLVQTNSGHLDSIRDICFIPERNHIVSVSWDKTIKIWKSFRKQNLLRKKKLKSESSKFDSWVWDQMKLALKNQGSVDLNSYNDESIT